MFLTTELSQEKVCFHPFCFLTFPWPPNLLSTAAPKSHQVLAHSLQSPRLWAFDPVSLPFLAHNVTCFLSLSPFLPGQLHEAHLSAHSLLQQSNPSLGFSSLSMAPRSLSPAQTSTVSFRPAFPPAWWAVSPAYLYQRVQNLPFSPSTQRCLLLSFLFLLVFSSVLVSQAGNQYYYFFLQTGFDFSTLSATQHSWVPRLGSNPGS